jgi:hypothetical protein
MSLAGCILAMYNDGESSLNALMVSFMCCSSPQEKHPPAERPGAQLHALPALDCPGTFLHGGDLVASNSTFDKQVPGPHPPNILPLPTYHSQDAPPRARHLAPQVQRLVRGQRAPRAVRARDERLEAHAAPRRAHQHRVAAQRALRRGRLPALHLDAGAHLRRRRALASSRFADRLAVEHLGTNSNSYFHRGLVLNRNIAFQRSSNVTFTR